MKIRNQRIPPIFEGMFLKMKLRLVRIQDTEQQVGSSLEICPVCHTVVSYNSFFNAYLCPCCNSSFGFVAAPIFEPEEEEEEDFPYEKQLTVKELRKMSGDKIHIHYTGHCKEFYKDVVAPYYGAQEKYISEHDGMLCAANLPLEYYGELWCATRA